LMWRIEPERELRWLERRKLLLNLWIKQVREEIELVNSMIENLRKEISGEAKPAYGEIVIAVPCDGPDALESRVYPVLGRAPYFAILTVEEGEVKRAEAVRNPFADSPGRAGPMAIEMLLSRGVRCIAAPHVGTHAMEALAQAGVRLVSAPPGVRVKDVVGDIAGRCASGATG